VFSTMVADTVAAFMTQTLESMPSPTATVTQPPVTKTSTSTATETPTEVPPNTSLTEMEDGSRQFFDYQAGVKLTLPAGWIPFRPNEPEYDEVLTLAKDDSVLQYGLDNIKESDPGNYRLYAFNTQEDYVFQGQGSQINVLFFENDSRSFEQILDDEEQHPTFTDYKFISASIQVRIDKLEIFTREEQWKVTSSTDEVITIYYRGDFFETPSGKVLIEFLAPLDIKDGSLSEYDQLIDNLSVFTP